MCFQFNPWFLIYIYNDFRFGPSVFNFVFCPFALLTKFLSRLLKSRFDSKSYDFTSQNMHYGLNRLKKSKMGKIGLKSSEIAKIG